MIIKQVRQVVSCWKNRGGRDYGCQLLDESSQQDTVQIAVHQPPAELHGTSQHRSQAVRGCEHITPALPQLPGCRRVDFEISTLIYHSLAGTAPVYLAECPLDTAAGHRPLRSADNQTWSVKRSRNQFGDRCFATAGPTLWNSLPEQLRQPDITFGQFKRL